MAWCRGGGGEVDGVGAVGLSSSSTPLLIGAAVVSVGTAARPSLDGMPGVLFVYIVVLREGGPLPGMPGVPYMVEAGDSVLDRVGDRI
jgi:hypothetical protein